MAPQVSEKTRKMMQERAAPYAPLVRRLSPPLKPEPLPDRSVEDYIVGKFFIEGLDYIGRVIGQDAIGDYFERAVFLVSYNDGESVTLLPLSEMVGKTFYSHRGQAERIAAINRARFEERQKTLDAARTSGTSP